MAIKFVAYFVTQSNSILTDALESIINVAATGFALYSLKLSAKPKDADHPYGHGKIEFFASGFEGALIIVAGLFIFHTGTRSLLHPNEIHHIDTGIYLILSTALVNLFLGMVLIKKGKEVKTEVLVADGKHLITDTISTFGVLISLVLVYFTGYTPLDSYVSIILSVYIIYNGYRTVRPAVAGLMDETDPQLIENITSAFVKHRSAEYIDVHNLRIVKYGSQLHIDCHITLPYYYSLEKSHDLVKEVENFLNKECENNVEIFIHADPCIPDISCKICTMKECSYRKFAFEKEIKWSTERLMNNEKHQKDTVD